MPILILKPLWQKKFSEWGENGDEFLTQQEQKNSLKADFHNADANQNTILDRYEHQNNVLIIAETKPVFFKKQ